MRHEDLKIRNLETQEQLERVKAILGGITGTVFVGADLETQVVEFDMSQDLDDLTITDIQCRLRDAGFEAGEIVEGQTCTVRFTKSQEAVEERNLGHGTALGGAMRRPPSRP